MARVYGLKRWQRTRIAFLADHPLCMWCTERGLLVPAVDVDHIIPIAKGGAWFSTDNLQALCHACHSKKTASDKGYQIKNGCDAQGMPVTRDHHWNDGEGRVAR